MKAHLLYLIALRLISMVASIAPVDSNFGVEYLPYNNPENPPIPVHAARKQRQRYCDLHRLNIPCKTACKRSFRCGQITTNYTALSDTNRRHVVAMVNRLRNSIAMGYDHVGFPPASNMRVISYDKECEFFAGCFLKGCFNRDNFIKIALDGTHLGSTGYGILSFNATPGRIGEFEVTDAFDGWYKSSLGPTKTLPYNRKAYIDSVLRDVQPNFANDFLQLGAANTTRIGCAKYERNLSSNLMFYQFYCVYKPAVKFGNGFLLYKSGKPASACGEWDEQPNGNYPGLCGEIRNTSKDQFTPFVQLNCSETIANYFRNFFIIYLTLTCLGVMISYEH